MRLSVVVATFNRLGLLRRLLEQLSKQTLAAADFEVVVVDDGSTEPVAAALDPKAYPYALRVVTQANAGAAAARDRGIREARADVIVITDDDMQVPEAYLAAHLALHPDGSRRVVVGRIKADPDVHDMPYWERWYADRFDRLAEGYASGRIQLSGSSLATGNCSLRRSDYLAVGGFDPSLKRSEDIELGYKLQEAGCQFVYSGDGYTLHGSDHTREDVWLRRAYLYGMYDSKIHERHLDLPTADPWRFLFRIGAPARPLIAAAVVAPEVTRPLSRAAILAVRAADRLGLTRLTFAGTAVVYSMEYYRGVRAEAGSLFKTAEKFARSLRAHRRRK